jgi:hypothetical protein
MVTTASQIRVADEVWLATALLHREQPDRADFMLKEIEARLRQENLSGTVRRGVYPHLSVHCVANTRPNPARYRMLFSTGPSRRRLFRPGDPFDPGRAGGKIVPRRDEVPSRYHVLIDWHEAAWALAPAQDPLLDLARRHRGMWKGVDADRYVRDLREGWK